MVYNMTSLLFNMFCSINMVTYHGVQASVRVLVRVGRASPLHVGVGLQRTDALWVTYGAGWHCVQSTAFNL